MPLSEESIQVVEATAPVVAEHALEITSTFYKTMFKNNPEVLAFFNKSHQKEGRQPRALADAVVAYATHLRKLDQLGPLVAKMAHRHVALSVKPEHYQIVHQNMMLAIGKVLGDAVTEEIANAWSESVLALAEICIGAEEELYKQNEARKGGWRYERAFKLVSKTPNSDDTIVFEFAPADGYTGGFDFSAGQYITVRCDGLGEAPRHYTLISKPGDKTLKINTRKVKGGAMSTYMHEKMQVGDIVRLGAPCGVFTLDEKKDAVLISAGIGITPMVSFVNELGKGRVKAALHVESCASRDALSSEFKKAGVENVTVNYTDKSGRISITEQAKALVKTAGPGVTYYICGPTEFMFEMTEALKSQGCDDVRSEVFGTGNTKTNHAAETEKPLSFPSRITQAVTAAPNKQIMVGLLVAGAAGIAASLLIRQKS